MTVNERYELKFGIDRRQERAGWSERVGWAVFSLEVVKEGCIGEGLDNDESEDGQSSLHVAEYEPERWVLGGSSVEGDPVWNL